jgi:hypothetical protein
MKIFKSLKKALVLVLTAILFTTAFTVTGAQIEAKAVTNEVSMYYVDSHDEFRNFSYDIYVNVKNLAYDKKVNIHMYFSPTSNWIDIPATYFKTLSDGTEIWKATIGYSYSNNLINPIYAIKYEVNGTTYWDNNNGNNYTYNQAVGVNAIKAQAKHWYEVKDLNNYSIKARVKNLAYNKVVKVRYTQDNWATASEKALIYSSSYSDINEEEWQTALILDPNKKDQFQYYVYYQVSGQTYYDNNFGINYNVNY